MLDKFDKDYNITEDDFFSLIEQGINIPEMIYQINENIQISNKILHYVIDNNIAFIKYFKAEAFNDDAINRILNKGYIPSKRDFKVNKYLCSTKLWKEAFARDPSMIIFYTGDDLSDYVKIASERGFIATYTDLQVNPELCKFAAIMKPAIKREPSLIKYFIFGEDDLGYDCIAYALFKYKLTERDIEDNPTLATNFYVMEFSPHLEKYSAFIYKGTQKQYIKNVIMSNDLEQLKELPFYREKFGSKINVDDILKLIKILYIDIKEDDLDEQESYVEVLDHLIDGVINIRYNKDKTNFLYRDIVAINDEIQGVFSKVTKEEDLAQLVVKFSHFTGETLDTKALTDWLVTLYKTYQELGFISLNDTSRLCNQILNYHRNYYFSKTKQNIKLGIIPLLDITTKKKNSISRNIRLSEIQRLIALDFYDELEMSENEFVNMVKCVSLKLQEYREIKNLNIPISSYNELEEKFLTVGMLTPYDVELILNCHNTKITRFISQKYERLKMHFIDNISFYEEKELSDCDKLKLALNHTNFVIASKKNYYNVLANLIVNLNQEILNKILDNQQFISEVKFLLPLVNLIPEFDDQTLLNILINYPRIRNKLLTVNSYSGADIYPLLLSNIHGLITLANGYSSIDDTVLAVLGNDIISYIGEQYSVDYLNVYLRMLQRQYSLIPPIQLKYHNRRFTSGLYADSERLLMGAKFKNSCIDLRNPAGEQTFKECLLKETGDVIMERNEYNEFVSRIMIFRRGNCVQLVLKNLFECSQELFEQIADQILSQAIAYDDNIDYVFLNECHTNKLNFELISDVRFITMFPHCDCTNQAWLLNTKKRFQGLEDEEMRLDFYLRPTVLYNKVRKNISYNPGEKEMTRLRALSIYYETDWSKKELLARNFEPFYGGEYSFTVCGEDWYIALRKDGFYEELVLPTNSPDTINEFKEVQKLMLRKRHNKPHNLI